MKGFNNQKRRRKSAIRKGAKKSISMFMTLFLTCSLCMLNLPVSMVSAEEAPACTHVCGDGTCSYVKGEACNHICGDGLCSSHPEIPCDHVCSVESGCITTVTDGEGHETQVTNCIHNCTDGTCSYQPAVPCNHVHSAACGYVAAVPCDHVCDENCGGLEDGGGIMLLSVGISNESEWITAANAVVTGRGTSGWNGELGEHVAEAVDYDTTGTLTWTASTGVLWNGNGDALTDLTANPGAGTLSAEQFAAEADPDCVPALDATHKIYYVYSPQQFLYTCRVLNNTSNKTDYTIEIMKDFNMNGANYSWPTDVTLEDFTTIHGNGCTIDNLRILGSSATANVGMISTCTSLNASRLKFRNAYVCGQASGASKTAVFVAFPNASNYNYANYWQLEDIRFEKSIAIGNSGLGNTQGSTAMLLGRMSASISPYPEKSYIKDCSVVDCVVVGGSHTGALTSTISTCMASINNCFSVGSSVISYGIHSGGLLSCLTKVSEINNCFVDAKVYGSERTGVFSGSVGDCHIYNCYSSGFVEGTKYLGGFVGIAESGASSTIVDCYSTALVGLRSSGSYLGGFIGDGEGVTSGYNLGIVNAYAAGEVGSADTDVTVTGPSRTDFIGGFAGRMRIDTTRAQMAYCYYDKQTTAMREWDNGALKAGWTTVLIQANPKILTDYISVGEKGLNGVLTTTTAKAGTGLTDNPTGATSGFMGFKDLTDFYNLTGTYNKYPKTKVAYTGWDYSAEDHYPELKAFSEASVTDWGTEYVDLVKAYSKASTSAPMLDTWEKGLDKDSGTKDGAALGPLIYDTVRDLTARFYLTTTSANEQKWARTETATGVAGVDKATVTIAGAELDVLQVTTTTALSFCDSFTPGVEWLETTTKVGNASATRRMRVMPTAGIEAGAGKTIYRPNEYAETSLKKAAFYDHADDVEMYFSTASRMATAAENPSYNAITTGIYPDSGKAETYAADFMTRDGNALTNRQKLLTSDTSDTYTSTYFTANGDNSYGGSGVTNTGEDISFMSRDPDTTVDAAQAVNNANGSTLFVYVRTVSSITTGSGLLATSTTLRDMTIADNADTYNGKSIVTGGQDEMLLFEYVWQMDDGRIIYDAKLISVKATPFEAKITAYDAGGLHSDVAVANKEQKDTDKGLLDTDDAYVDVCNTTGHLTDEEAATTVSALVYTDADNRTQDILHPFSTSGGALLSKDQIGPEYGDTLVASWKVTNDDKVVTMVKIKMDSGRNDSNGEKVFFEAEVNPAVTKTLTVPYEYYRYVVDSEGAYYVTVEHLDREYEIKQSGDVYYLVFNKFIDAYDAATNPGGAKTAEGYPIDVVDVANNIEVSIELSPVLEFNKVVSGTLGDQNKEFSFTLNLNDKIPASTLAYSYYITHADGSKTSTPAMKVYNGNNVIPLKHKDKVTVTGLPYGSEYTMTETNYATDGYITKADGITGSAVTGTMNVTTEWTNPQLTNGVYTADRNSEFKNIKNEYPVTDVKMNLLPFILMMVGAMLAIVVMCALTLWSKRMRYRKHGR